ncbi:hypothetical protein QVD17_31761 [Tagetes erecta]|uniref:Transmembrane protein n=1 Tax=Tagetes erecta TaxID=13708 RepID=A0AAD8K688_TARER|nr:hypothetical protein QVD17_31761 [Tagetes erecta]
MSSSATETTANRRRLYRLTNLILNTHSLHFILISLLFLPITFSASAAVKFFSSSSSSNTNFDSFNIFILKTILNSSQNLLTIKTLVTILAFICIVILPSIVGVALITYTTNQIIHHKHLTFSSTFESLSRSFIPLLYTIMVGSITLILIFLAFTLLPIVLIKAIEALVSHIDRFMFALSINLISSYVLAMSMVYFLVIWGSAAAITILESKSGFKALQQSANQSTEFRRHSFSIVFITGFVIGTSMWYLSVSQNWMILQVGASCLQSSLMMLLYVVANTVLYVQSKVESAEEVATTTMLEGAVSGEYVRVDVNDKNGDQALVVHELAEKEVNGGFNYVCYLLGIVWGFLLCVQFYDLFLLFSDV